MMTKAHNTINKAQLWQCACCKTTLDRSTNPPFIRPNFYQWNMLFCEECALSIHRKVERKMKAEKEKP